MDKRSGGGPGKRAPVGGGAGRPSTKATGYGSPAAATPSVGRGSSSALSALPPTSPRAAASTSHASGGPSAGLSPSTSTHVAPAASSSRSLPPLPDTVLSRIASFLPIEGVEAFSQVSHATYGATSSARAQIASLNLTGKATVGNQHFYSSDAEGAPTRFYWPTSPSGGTQNFPHLTRKSDASLTPHLTDLAAIRQDVMPNGLPAGDYPTRHRYDVQPNRKLSAVILPQKNSEKSDGATLAQVNPSSGLSPMHYVAPRFKAKADAKVPAAGPGTPRLLSEAQTLVGGNPQNWASKEVKFFRKG